MATRSGVLALVLTLAAATTVALAGQELDNGVFHFSQVDADAWAAVMDLRQQIVDGSITVEPIFGAEDVRALVTLSE